MPRRLPPPERKAEPLDADERRMLENLERKWDSAPAARKGVAGELVVHDHRERAGRAGPAS